MEVKIVDQHYKDLFKQLAAAQDMKRSRELYCTVTSRLHEIGWPQNIMSQRVRNDIQMVLNGVYQAT
jgi:hypothetical protein